MIKTEIVIIGTELLFGHITDESASILNCGLAKLGCVLRWKSIVGDLQEDIESVLRQAASRAGLIITTGGLGEGEDNITRKAVSQAVGRRLVLNEKLLEKLENGLQKGKDVTSKRYSRKALVPARSRILFNSRGTSYGFGLHWGNCHLVSLPGNPPDMEQVFLDAAVPYLSERLKRRSVIRMLTVRTAGLTSREIDERLEDVLDPRILVKFGVKARRTEEDVHLRSSGRTEEEAENSLRPVHDKIRERLKDAVYGEKNDTLEAVVGRMLVKKGLSLAVAESCTGGLIGHRLTNIPGSSVYLERVEVCYSNRSKVDVLEVPSVTIQNHGAVSAETAAAMAQGVLIRAKTDLGLSITGIAGPSGATLGKPVGLVFFGLATRKGVQTVSERFQGGREAIKAKASQKALDLLRRHLLQTE